MLYYEIMIFFLCKTNFPNPKIQRLREARKEVLEGKGNQWWFFKNGPKTATQAATFKQHIFQIKNKCPSQLKFSR